MADRNLHDVLAEVEDWAPDTVAVGVTDGAATLATHGPVDRRLWLASVTKPLSASGVLLAAAQGHLRLDEPVEVPGTLEAVTVRHLLAHAGGLAATPGGNHRPPEQRRIYADWGYGVLGELVAERVGLPFSDHLAIEVFEPLGMTDTTLEGAPGHGGRGTVEDLLRFARELLAPSVLPAGLLAEATRVAFPGLDGVVPGYGRRSPNDWGLGFEVKGSKSDHWMGHDLPPTAFGHFGRSGAFLWVDPTRGAAAAELADREFGPWAQQVWGGFNDRLVTALDDGEARA